MGCAFRFEIAGLGLVGRRLGWKVWGWWVGAGPEWCVGLRFQVGGLGLVGRRWGWKVWGWWVGAGPEWCVGPA